MSLKLQTVAKPILNTGMLCYLLLFAVVDVRAQVALESFNLSNGSSTLQSTTYHLKATIGQPLLGIASSANYSTASGFDAATSAAIPRLPDLQFNQPDINPISVAPGSEVVATFILKNSGDAEVSGNIIVKSYLSINQTYDEDDIELASFSVVNGLGAGTQFSFPGTGQNGKIVIPPSTALGSYQILLVIDPGNTVNEKSKANNLFVKAITVGTSSSNPLSVSSPSTNGLKISVTLSNGSGTRTVKFYSRPILGSDFTETEITSTSNTYEVTATTAQLDDLGLEYYFTASDATTVTPIKSPSSTNGFIYTPFAANEKSIQGLSFGGNEGNYRIISVPYKLNEKQVLSVFGALGEYDKTQWRLIHYDKGKNKDYPAFGTSIEQGIGYWFNALNQTEIKLKAGTAPENNQSKPFVISLNQGWNQIGNPYPFNIKWSAVQEANAGKPIGALKIYDGTFKESNDLKVWSGGFVFADNAMEIEFPVALKQASGGRVGQASSLTNSRKLTEREWFVPITLTHGQGANNMIGFGMHPQASESKDRFDDITLPRFFNFLEMSTHHHEYFAPQFTRDVVPTSSAYTWTYTINSSFSAEKAMLSWNPEDFGDNSAQLFLFDDQQQTFVDMRTVNHYNFTLSNDRVIRFVYAADESSMDPGFTFIGRPYPNPASNSVTVPLVVKNTGNVTMEVIDMLGKPVKTLVRGRTEQGIHDIVWSCDDAYSNRVQSGIYLIRLSTEGVKRVQKVVIK